MEGALLIIAAMALLSAFAGGSMPGSHVLNKRRTQGRLELTSTTNLRLTRDFGTTAQALYVGYEVVEFY